MRAPLSWLRDFAPLDAPLDDLVTSLSNLGLVVEGVMRAGTGLGAVAVARVLAIRPHPSADRIRLVDVDAGGGDTLQIACGAHNFAVGDLVPLAPAGTTLPGGMEIGRRKMRGEWSEGMLCSAGELGLDDPAGVDGLLVLPANLSAPGTPLDVALDLRPDVVFDLEVSPNRPDALCMAGVARDLAAALGQPWALPAAGVVPAVAPGPELVADSSVPLAPELVADSSVPLAPELVADSSVPLASVAVEAGDLCPLFTATVLTGVPLGGSPAWLARRLTLAGMRPINATVDVSNYVMLDLGQPNHPYDLERLGGAGLLVRRARAGEVLRTLDGVERALHPDDCLICDAIGAPVGIGGIMGGATAEISPTTTTILLEAAYFTPMAIARTGSRLGLSSEARTRFERGADPEAARAAVERFVALLAAPGRGDALRRGATIEVRHDAHLPKPVEVEVRTRRVNTVLGTSLDDGDVARLLAPIGFAARPAGPGIHSVRVPTWRPDAEREVDVIEEVGRMWGLGRIERRVPPGMPGGSGGLTAHQRQRRRVREILVGAGCSEAWTTTFLAPGDLERAGLATEAVEVENPLDRSGSILRPALLPGLLKAVRFNADRQQPDVRLFEIGRVFALPSGDRSTPDEREDMALVASGPDVDGRVAAQVWAVLAGALALERCDLAAAELPGLHPSRSARVLGPDAAVLGVLGEVAPDVVAAYGCSGRVAYLSVDLELLLAQPRRPGQARQVSRFPASDVDLALVVDDAVPATAVQATLRSAGAELLEAVTLFDTYRGPQVGPGRRSLAFRLRWRAPDRTLTDAELAAARQRAIDSVVAAHRAEPRT